MTSAAPSVPTQRKDDNERCQDRSAAQPEARTGAGIQYYASRGYRWVADADIQGCFDNIAHQMVLGCVRARIKDKEAVALVRAFL